MSEAVTSPETAAERITREIAEALDRFVDETTSEAEAAARLASDTSAILARIQASAEQQDA